MSNELQELSLSEIAIEMLLKKTETKDVYFMRQLHKVIRMDYVIEALENEKKGIYNSELERLRKCTIDELEKLDNEEAPDELYYMYKTLLNYIGVNKNQKEETDEKH
jgi:hypothetical protein